MQRTGMLRAVFLSATFMLISGCLEPPPTDETGDGPIADGISAKLGDPLPGSTAEQLATFERGRDMAQKRFDLAEGLGPEFNATFCGSCHERPVVGGSAGLYRNFFIAGQRTSNGSFIMGDFGGVVRMFSYEDDMPERPVIALEKNVFTQRNPIPFFGAGLIAELDGDTILANADPDDLDGDGISGRANFENALVGRFGRKSQTTSIEGFVRGPLFNHLGVTTDPLPEADRALLPVDSSLSTLLNNTSRIRQAAALDEPNRDDDGVPDPEMSKDELFDLVSFVMLLAAPELEELTEQGERGRLLFHDAGCSDCHIPRLDGPRGPLPLYSDLLIHDMGEELADGIEQGVAKGNEFRTHPLWGIASVGPYLHDGRADTLADAILMHGGEGQAARDAFDAMTETEQGDLIEFLLSLGGRDQTSTGLLEPDAPVPGVGEYGGPLRELDAAEMERFIRGRELFDHDFGYNTGIGAMAGADGGARFNGDSCRACHFDPVIGGSGPRGVNVMRHGSMNEEDVFSAPTTTPNTILHTGIVVGFNPPEATEDINVFEQRQTPAVFGLGLIDAIADATILANEDPTDANSDGISGRAHILADGRVGRLGWKSQVPEVAEFVRDAMAAELGLTVEDQSADGLFFGMTEDIDLIADPELMRTEAEDMAFYMSMLAGPPRQAIDPTQADEVDAGRALFDSVGCTKCHIPALVGALGDVPLYSDLLLHDILAEGSLGIEDGDASPTEFRTAPLWGISQTAPYFHTGRADTIEEAVGMHNGEATSVREAFMALSDADREALLLFLQTL
ncbi:MAG: hypothetical protein DHS20C16_07230 [Phycisphaerae bacterium]|nr:MAG: hypothetical protein DHS20C16_07230 [Phycisphaerae bacterium]